MKILITGANGMLGSALCEELSRQHMVVGLGRSDCDITRKDELITKISHVQPEIIIHTAAFTDVDRCEQDLEKADRINAKGTEAVAIACQKANALLVYISSDYVFDGKKKEPYLESDRPNPVNVYGKTKLEGERLVQSMLKKYLIVRSSWLFGRGRKNFVDHIIEHAEKEKVLSIVNDKFGSPTYAPDLAKAIKILLSAFSFQLSADIYGIYHITNFGTCSWYEYAQKILASARLKDVKLIPIALSELNLKALRPKYSVLDNRRYRNLSGEFLRPWPEAVAEYVKSRGNYA